MIEVRAARPTDASTIARIHTDTWESTYTGVVPQAYLESITHDERLTDWKQMLIRAPQGIFVAEHSEMGGMGFVSCSGANEPIRGDFGNFRGEINYLYVRPECQGMGLGKQLFDTAIANLVKAGYSAVLFWVLGDASICGFLERTGGRLIAERPTIIAGTEMREIAYGWDGKTAITAE